MYRILTDGSCDLSPEFCRTHQITVLPMYYSLASTTPVAYPNGAGFLTADFYAMLKAGMAVKTSAPSLEDCKELMRPLLAQGQDLLYTGLSARLSGVFNAVRLAALDLKEEFPERKIAVLDSGCASLGLGLLLQQIAGKREQGTSFEDACAFCTELRQRIRHFFTVNDMQYLKRGGRISGGAAAVATVLQIMPMMQMLPGSAIENTAKVRGRKAALRQLADNVGECAEPGTPVFLAHAAVPEDAAFLRDTLRRKFGLHEILIGDMGPVIGAHGGPGAIAGFCIAKNN